MARRGDGLYQRGKTWWLDFTHRGERHVVRLGRNISRTVAGELARVQRAAVLKGVNSGHFDRHYHDCNEYWLICKGKAKVWIDGQTYYVKDGDIVCIKKGLEHDILELYEPIVGYHFEDATPPGGRTGHLHKSEEMRKGHDVPKLPVPADFPKD